MSSSKHFLIGAAALWSAFGLGCHVTPKYDSEVDTLLKAVSYDTKIVPVSQTSFAAHATATPPSGSTPPVTSTPPAKSSIGWKEKASAVGQSVGDGVRTAAGFLLFGVFKIVEAAFDDDDDDGETFDSTPLGRADRDFNRGLDARERWERDQHRG